MANYHVTKRKGSLQWSVLRENADRASSTVRTQAPAEKLAKQLARKSGGGEVRIHRPDGTIRDSDTVPPAKGPFPPRDKKQ